MNQLPVDMDCLYWQLVPREVERLIKEASPAVAAIRRATGDLPAAPGYGDVYYHPKRRTAWVSLGDSDEEDRYKAWEAALKTVPHVKDVRMEAEARPPEEERGEWIRIKRAETTLSDILVPIRQATGHTELDSGPLPLWPSPLAATLAGGAIGGGLGYGAGALLEQLMPDTWQKKRLSRTLAVVGALGLGGLPGLLSYAGNKAEGKGGLDAGSWSRLKKSDADDMPLSAGAFFAPHIAVDSFNNVIWQDEHTPPAIQAATSGLVTAASLSRGNFGERSPFISPFDVAKVAIGAGSGYVSGALVGRALGALAGMPDSMQQRLQDIGLWSGVLRTVVPLALGG